ncbi:hypothetical protein FBY30_4159 [Arthrobacter sp. SLBN-83]|uniref:hypothetical protein n=1 Tax=Arthrobacter sp. SLBN-83 TaxID=2768449 RepID=UPI001152BFD9|nr:hypothetical protein [Arthrobacter sp. SLBN-83]TQJ61841.1 hypothetical protein FBY30_4159 [Arthrobacter sp. SLBN-83]
MTPSAPLRHAVSTTASAAVLALAFGFFPAGPALAATAEPTPVPASDTQAPSDCGLICVPILAGSPDSSQPGRPRKSKEPVAPPAPPAPPAEPPAQPAQPQPPQTNMPPQPVAPALDPAAIPATEAAVPDEPAPDTASAAAGYRPPTGPSSGQDWNSPVTRSAAPAQLAAVAPAGGHGPDGPALLPIVAGTVLLAVSAGAFAWWTRNRNRLRSH